MSYFARSGHSRADNVEVRDLSKHPLRKLVACVCHPYVSFSPSPTLLPTNTPTLAPTQAPTDAPGPGGVFRGIWNGVSSYLGIVARDFFKCFDSASICPLLAWSYFYPVGAPMSFFYCDFSTMGSLMVPTHTLSLTPTVFGASLRMTKVLVRSSSCSICGQTVVASTSCPAAQNRRS